jgi:WD40 repeat protein
MATAPGEVAARHGDNFVRIWDVETGKLLEKLQHRDAVNAVAFSPDGRMMATACSDRAAYLWHTKKYSEFGLPFWHQHAVTSVTFSPDGKTIFTGSRDQTARAWDADTRKLRGAPLLHQDAVTAVAAFTDNHCVIVGCGDVSERRWSVI